MNSSLMFMVAARNRRERRRKIIGVISHKKKGRKNQHMQEVLSQMIGKKCQFYTIDDDHLVLPELTIVSVTDNAVVCSNKKGNKVIINLDYVIEVDVINDNK